jgi:ankyrin repeat protein
VEAGAFIDLPDWKGNTPLMLACGNRQLGCLEELLEKGAYVNPRDYFGRTPLMLLAVLGEDEMMKVLLRFKPDVHAIDYGCRTALTYAKQNRRKTIIRILDVAGAKF